MNNAGLQIAINNLIMRGNYAISLGDYKTAGEYFRIASSISDAIDKGETDTSLIGKYLIEYAAGMHR